MDILWRILAEIGGFLAAAGRNAAAAAARRSAMSAPAAADTTDPDAETADECPYGWIRMNDVVIAEGRGLYVGKVVQGAG